MQQPIEIVSRAAKTSDFATPISEANLSLILDCESHESSIRSVCEVYGAYAADVIGFLSGIDLDEEYKTKTIGKPSDEYLVELFERKFGQARSWDSVCWFYLTRVQANTDFAEGILPLHLALEKIWQTILSIANSARRRSNLEKLRAEGVPDFQYNLKTSNVLHSGPFAMLVRESAFQSTAMGNHDYLRLPEIVEDICNGYEQRFGERIFEEVADALKPCIVKFEATDRVGLGLVEPTLTYCWTKIHGQKLFFDSNTCYDAKGEIVPRSAIRNIEFV